MATANSIKHGHRFIDLTGQSFGRWTVLEFHSRDRRGVPLWLCRCKCGNEKPVVGYDLAYGKSTKCRRCGNKTHGLQGTPEYEAWRSMNSRCTYSGHASYALYAGRGIVVCQRWRDSFEAFLEDMGPKPSPQHSLGRIDNDGDYCPENCRWETPSQQSRNKRTNHVLAFRGETKCLTDWADELGIDARTLTYRLKHGWTVDDALTIPAGSTHTERNRLLTHDGKTLCLSEWSTLTGINAATLHCRLARGWSISRAMTTPVRIMKRKAR